MRNQLTPTVTLAPVSWAGLPDIGKSNSHNACYERYGDPMDLIPIPAGTSNAERHRELLGAWLASYGSTNTRDANRRDAMVFLAYLEATGLELLAVRRAHLDVFARTRQAAGDVPATLNRRLATVSALYAYAVDDGALQLNPAARVRRAAVNADHSTTAPLTRREAEDLLAVARAHSPRAHALVDLLLSTGIRISEALGARLLALSADRLVITRKGGKTAVIPLPEHTVAALRVMAGTTGTELARGDEATGWLFATARELGVALHHLQGSLGHTDPRTTRRYDHTRSRLEHSSAHRVGALFG